MFANAIAAADDRGLALDLLAQAIQVIGGLVGRADFRVTQHNHIRVTADRAHRVRQILALVNRGETHTVTRRDHFTTEATHRGLERQVGTGAGLVEQCRHQRTCRQLEQTAIRLLDALADRCGGIEENLQVVAIQLIDRDNMLVRKVAVDFGRGVFFQEPLGLT